jgi:hypothetical protein
VRNPLLVLVTVVGLVGVPVLSAQAASDGSRTASATKRRCDPNYKGACLRPDVSDYDCAGGSGDGPYYVRGPVKVVGRDHYRLDADHDGIGCE